MSRQTAPESAGSTVTTRKRGLKGFKTGLSDRTETALYFLSAAAFIFVGQVVPRLLYLFPVCFLIVLLGVWILPALLRRLRS